MVHQCFSSQRSAQNPSRGPNNGFPNNLLAKQTKSVVFSDLNWPYVRLKIQLMSSFLQKPAVMGCRQVSSGSLTTKLLTNYHKVASRSTPKFYDKCSSSDMIPWHGPKRYDELAWAIETGDRLGSSWFSTGSRDRLENTVSLDHTYFYPRSP